MKRIFCALMFLAALPARSDMFGADIPLLTEIVVNTLNTLNELRSQTQLLDKQLAGIDEAIYRIQAIKDLVKPSEWNEWKNPMVAAERLRRIYHLLPPQFQNERSQQVEAELSKAMRTASLLTEGAKSSFASGKELERLGAEKSPGVAEKLTASGVGTLVTLESQNQVAQATIISLLSQMLAETASTEQRRLQGQATEYQGIEAGLGGFSRKLRLPEVKR